MKPKVTHIDYHELDLPDIVYKYRTWTDEKHKTILTSQIVYMSSPFDFEDPKECKAQKRYDLLTENDIYHYYYQDSTEKNPERTRQQHRKYARDWLKKSPMKQPKFIAERQKKHLKDFADRFGVLSLTSNPYSNDMWLKYSGEHFGICIGFDPKIMFRFLGGGGKVEYYDELPIIYPNDDFDTEHSKQVFCKEKKWKLEDEYRTHMFYKNPATILDRQIKLPIECFIEIIFGYYTTKENESEIRKICDIQGLTVHFKKVTSIQDGKIIISAATNS